MNKSSKFSIKLANIFSNEKKNSTTSQATSASAELEASQEKARKETFNLTKTSRIGFPHKPTCMAYDVMQHILAIGTKHGYVKLYGGPSIEYTLYHASSIGNSCNSNSSASMAATSANSTQTQSSGFSTAVLFMNFVCNEGVLITYCDDGTISLWNLRQKQPGILFSKKLINEK
jgi:syntaxin-binding protein 5